MKIRLFVSIIVLTQCLSQSALAETVSANLIVGGNTVVLDGENDQLIEPNILDDGNNSVIVALNGTTNYNDCSLEYRRSKRIKIVWKPPSGFSNFSANDYTLTLSLIEPFDKGNIRDVLVAPPIGFTADLISEIEQTSSDNTSISIRKFFQSAFSMNLGATLFGGINQNVCSKE